jgi:hypothetical protein
MTILISLSKHNILLKISSKFVLKNVPLLYDLYDPVLSASTLKTTSKIMPELCCTFSTDCTNSSYNKCLKNHSLVSCLDFCPSKTIVWMLNPYCTTSFNVVWYCCHKWWIYWDGCPLFSLVCLLILLLLLVFFLLTQTLSWKVCLFTFPSTSLWKVHPISLKWCLYSRINE